MVKTKKGVSGYSALLNRIEEVKDALDNVGGMYEKRAFDNKFVMAGLGKSLRSLSKSMRSLVGRSSPSASTKRDVIPMGSSSPKEAWNAPADGNNRKRSVIPMRVKSTVINAE